MTITRRQLGGILGAAVAAVPANALSAECGGEESAGSAIVTARRLSKFAPNAPIKIIDAIADNWGFANAAGITHPLLIAHFFAQIATETAGLTILEENLNYTAARLRKIFPSRIKTLQDAVRLERRPVAIANTVYARPEMGNKEANDGWKYRGRGFIQITFKANYQRVQDKFLDKLRDESGEIINLVENPEKVSDPVIGFKVAVLFWSLSNVNALAANDDLRGVRKRINGGHIGIDVAKVFLARAKSVFQLGSPETGSGGPISVQEFEAVGILLRNLGLAVGGSEEASSPTRIVQGLARFQRENGLPDTGAYTDETLSALIIYEQQLNAGKKAERLDIR